MVSRYYGGSVPAAGDLDELDQQLIATAHGLPERVDTALERYAPNEALAAIWELIAAANKYVVVVQPWTLAKRRAEGTAEQRLATSLYNLIETLRLVAHALVPLLPATAVAIACQLGIALDAGAERSAALAWGGYPAGTSIQPGAVLFPKHDQAEVDE
jgi:methionyl-tRNA synthetase